MMMNLYLKTGVMEKKVAKDFPGIYVKLFMTHHTSAKN